MPLSSPAVHGPGHRDESCGCLSAKHSLHLKLVRLVCQALNYQPFPSQHLPLRSPTQMDVKRFLHLLPSAAHTQGTRSTVT